MANLPTVESESFWLTIWNDIKDGGTSFLILLILLTLYSLKKYIIQFFDLVSKKLFKKIDSKNREYTKSDVLSHPIFRNLDFWLSTGIKSIRFNQIPSHYPMIKTHTESLEYLKAKEEMAKDILTIKYSVIKDYLNDILKTDFTGFDLEVLKKDMDTSARRCILKQQTDMYEAGIPSAFLTKYIVYEQNSNELLYKAINTMLDEKAFDLDIYTRIYLILNIIDSYLTDVFNNIAYTVSSINGDLNGVEYKGHIIGTKNTKLLQPPHATFIMPVQEKLTAMMTEFGAARAYMVKYYQSENGDYLRSCVYEVCSPGIAEQITNIQGLPCNHDEDILSYMKKHTIIAADISKFNNYVSKNLSERGVNAVIIAPLFDNEDFLGTIMLDYMSVEDFNSKIDPTNIDESITKYANDLAPYMVYPKDYKF